MLIKLMSFGGESIQESPFVCSEFVSEQN